MTSITISSGEIFPETLYTIDRAKELLGWGTHAMRQARRNGLVVKYTAGRAYIRGEEIIRYIDECGKDSK